MSSLKLKHSGGNSVSLNPPTSAPTSSEVAFKLPTSDGSAGQVLTTDGSGNLSWVSQPSGITMIDHWRLDTTYDIPTNSTTIISTADWVRPNVSNDGFAQLGTGMSVDSSNHAAGIWTFPSTGFYLVGFGGMLQNPDNDGYEVFVRLEATENNSTFGEQTRVYLSGERSNYMTSFGQAIYDVTDTSQVKMRLRVYSASSGSDLKATSIRSETYITVIRLGDT